MPSPLPKSLQHPLLWQGGRRQAHIPVLPSGNEPLDQLLPGGGWPLGALTELLVERDGVGELSLVLPMLARVSREGGWTVLVDPPWTPYAPAIHGQGIDLQRLLVVNTRNAGESLWACEQALRGVRGGVVLSWLRGRRHQAGFKHLRRLQLAARSGQKGAFLFRSARVAGQSSPASLRLLLDVQDQDLCLTLLKGRGCSPGEQLKLRRPHRIAPRPTELPRSDAQGQRLLPGSVAPGDLHKRPTVGNA